MAARVALVVRERQLTSMAGLVVIATSLVQVRLLAAAVPQVCQALV
jgi:hypothetical protein